MSMEWFDRVSHELQEELNSVCEKYDQVGQMTIDRSAKHPLIEFFVETDDDETEFFCTLLYDPHNGEFYVETFDVEYEQLARVILPDIEDVIDVVHVSFHDFINGDSYLLADEDEDDVELILDVDDDGEFYIEEIGNEVNTVDKLAVEWETPEMTAFQVDEKVEVTYQFGVVSATGNGVLRRVNRYLSNNDELHKEESSLTFAKEEASTIIALIASHMDTMTSYENQ